MYFNSEQIVTWTQTFLRMQHDVTLAEASAVQLHDCLAQVIMMGIHDDWSKNKKERGKKRHAYYFSAEYLVGRLVYSNLYNLGLLEELRALFAEKGADLSCLEEIEDAALGNGGLGRLAAC